MNRIIALIDMDCFYVQVEQKNQPSLLGLPCAVVQYKTYKGGGIIAVNYEARALGVTRGMMGDDAKSVCSEVHLFRVPESRGKADLTKYREAGADVIETLMKMNLQCCVERASIDEAYVDLTAEVDKRIQDGFVITVDHLPNTVIAKYKSDEDENDKKEFTNSELVKEWLDSRINAYDIRLAIGACIAEEMRAAIFEETNFRCSAGVSHNKVLAKLACGLNKPNKQTLLSQDAVHHVFSTTSLHKVRNLGGKLGRSLKDDLGVKVMADLLQFKENELVARYGLKNGSWLYNLCRGIEHEPVQSRQLAQSIGCSKNFNGKEQLDTKEKVHYWLLKMSEEVVERLLKDRESNHRSAKTMTVSLYHLAYPHPQSSTRSCPLKKYDSKDMADTAFSLLQEFNTSQGNSKVWAPAIVNMGIVANKFVDLPKPSIAPNLKTFLAESLPAKTIDDTIPPCFERPPITMTDDDASEHDVKQFRRHQSDKSLMEIITNDGQGRVSSKNDHLLTPRPKDKVVKWLEESHFDDDCEDDDDDDDDVCAVEPDEKIVVGDSAGSSLQSFVQSRIRGSEISGSEALRKSLTTDSKPGEISTARVPTNPIEAFLKRRMESSQELLEDENSSPDWIKCSKCHQMISMWDVPEHDDYHFAFELQRQQNRLDIENMSNGGKKNKQVSTPNNLDRYFNQNCTPSRPQNEQRATENSKDEASILKRRSANPVTPPSKKKKKPEGRICSPVKGALDKFLQKRIS